MVYIGTDAVEYEVLNGTGGEIGYVKAKVTVSDSVVYDVGVYIDFYAYGQKVKRGIVRYIKKYNMALYELYAVGEEDTFQRQFVRRKVTPEMVGKVNEMDVSDVVRWLVDNYSNFTYDISTIVDTGYKIKRVVLSDKISSILNRFADAVGYVWYVKDGKFYFKPPETKSLDVAITNSDAKFGEWEIMTDLLANDVHVFGARLEYLGVDYFAGDGTTTEFKLSYIPSGNIRVYVEGEEVSSSEYEIDKDNQVIRFKTAPPAKATGVTVFTQWHWRRPITVTNNTGSNKSNPVIILRLNDNNFDLTSLNPDMSDLRFGTLSGTEFPWVNLGTDENENIVIAVKLNGVTIANGSNYTFYAFYGNSNASKPLYDYADVLGVHDDFNYDGELDPNKWTIKTYWVAAPRMNMKYYVRKAYDRAYIKVNVYRWDSQSTNGQVKVDVTPNANHSLWIYWYEQGEDPNKHIGLNITTVKPEFKVGYNNNNGTVTKYQDGAYVVLAKGMYYADVYFDMDNGSVSLGSRELHADYNVEVRYNFIVPIYANMQDYPSIEKYGRVSVELRMDWIRDFDTATLIASKYLQEFREPKYRGKAVMSDYKLISYGIEEGMMVWVVDNVNEIDRVMVVHKIRLRNGVAELELSEHSFNVYKWGALIEHRVRQLETAGDENFFTPLWQR